MSSPTPHEEVAAFAILQGASAARSIATDEVVIEDHLRDLCGEPRCPSFGTSAHCPPHCEGPDDLRKLLQGRRSALLLRLDVPVEATAGEGRREVGRLLHDITADVEAKARELGFTGAAGFSSGGCRRTYCDEHESCAALEPGGECRHPDRARTSLSALGVNSQSLLRAAGWLRPTDEPRSLSTPDGIVRMLGLVLLD